MIPWLSLFSQFTPEALLIEALLIFLLMCCYIAFWILKKRRFGSAKTVLPSGPVQTYLNQLIGQAEHLRIQLFGLSGIQQPLPLPQGSGMGSDMGSGTESANRILLLESQLKDQVKSLETLTAEKLQIQKELTLAQEKTAATSGTNTTPSSSPEYQELQKKVGDLEGRLSEYSVIEDDLANLKRLQQENAQLKIELEQLKQSIEGQGTQTPISSGIGSQADIDALLKSAEQSDKGTAPPTTDPTAPSLENKTTETIAEETLPRETPDEPPAESSAAEAAQDSPEATPEPNRDEEADLVAEFERMLKG
jgi:hypothetical protein